MRIIIKNANFSVYGISDISGLMNTLMSKFHGITSSNKASVEAFLRALGVDGSNNIWSKIKHLYMPCLGIPDDGDNALYDIIGGSNFPKTDYATTATIEAKRGVVPTSRGSTIGTVALSGITAANQSFFASFTRYSLQSIGQSSGVQVQLGSNSTGLGAKWENTVMTSAYMGDSSVKIEVSKDTGFSTPNWIVLSCRENGSRKMICADNNTTSSTLESSLTVAPAVAHLAKGYVCTSIFGICDGLTASEASTVSSAISTFITAFGIENTVTVS